MIDLDKIEAAARASLTYSENIGEYAWYVPGEIPHLVNTRPSDFVFPVADDSYIAALSPDVALALVAVVRAAIALDDAAETYAAALPQGVIPAVAALRDALKGVGHG